MRALLLAIFTSMLFGCAQTPDWDFDDTVNFSQYSTFAFVEPVPLAADKQHTVDDLTGKRIKEAVTKNLVGKGMRLVDVKSADILINYHAHVEAKVEERRVAVNRLPSYDFYDPWVSHAHNVTREYSVGTLVIDVIDNGKQRLVWRGAKNNQLKSEYSPPQREKFVGKVVTNILENFPPQE